MNNLYVKKPIPVEAFCFNEDPMPEWFLNHPFKMIHRENGNVQITISTLEGDTALDSPRTLTPLALQELQFVEQ